MGGISRYFGNPGLQTHPDEVGFATPRNAKIPSTAKDFVEKLGRVPETVQGAQAVIDRAALAEKTIEEQFLTEQYLRHTERAIEAGLGQYEKAGEFMAFLQNKALQAGVADTRAFRSYMRTGMLRDAQLAEVDAIKDAHSSFRTRITAA